MSVEVDSVPVQLLDVGLFGDPQLIIGKRDHCTASTHFALDEASYQQQLRDGLRRQWADPVRWLLGDPATEDIRQHQRFWLQAPGPFVSLPNGPQSTIEPRVDPFTFEVTGFKDGTSEAGPAWPLCPCVPGKPAWWPPGRGGGGGTGHSADAEAMRTPAVNWFHGFWGRCTPMMFEGLQLGFNGPKWV